MICGPNFIFVHLQKTGGTFVREYLLRVFPGSYSVAPKHRSAVSIPNRNGKIVFGIVRNPWDWYVSWWASNTDEERLGPPVSQLVFGESGRHDDFNKFLKFVLTENYGRQHDFHSGTLHDADVGVYTFRYRQRFLQKGRLLLDEVARTETLRDDVARILPLTDGQRELLFSMDSVFVSPKRDGKSYRDYYSDESVELVRHKDRLVVETYGYEF